MPDTIISHMVHQSNLYAQQLHRAEHFVHITLPELKAFFGILIFMGIHPLPSMKLYWSQDQNFHVERIARIMPLKRFLFILRQLHINDNTQIPAKGTDQFDKLYKLRPLIDHLQNSFRSNYTPSRNLAINESMVA